ncbi:hypothetical protein TEQG_04188 [Trichophyton equinum CBS 127.97]|uniref:Uncharacterized protein n=1 Tax=Trichophyton equinum (strain ATCC MYA-4606 / CBS 127.97) TaxID=559882 RepID=F2PTF2_TRIEC|nr:hypothetical protein TEQG_04188 [Trichophyton equinum CBS 127.97]
MTKQNVYVNLSLAATHTAKWLFTQALIGRPSSPSTAHCGDLEVPLRILAVAIDHSHRGHIRSTMAPIWHPYESVCWQKQGEKSSGIPAPRQYEPGPTHEVQG